MDDWEVFYTDRKIASEYSLEFISREIAEDDFYQDPCDQYDVEIGVKVKEDDKPRWFSITTQPSVEFYSKEIEGKMSDRKPTPQDLEFPTYYTDIYDMITSNSRISKKLFEKVVEPMLDRGAKNLEKLILLEEELEKKEARIKQLEEGFLRTRDRLRSKLVSMRAFDIFDDELKKVGLK